MPVIRGTTKTIIAPRTAASIEPTTRVATSWATLLTAAPVCDESAGQSTTVCNSIDLGCLYWRSRVGCGALIDLLSPDPMSSAACALPSMSSTLAESMTRTPLPSRLSTCYPGSLDLSFIRFLPSCGHRVTMNDFGNPKKRSVLMVHPGNIPRSLLLGSQVTSYSYGRPSNQPLKVK